MKDKKYIIFGIIILFIIILFAYLMINKSTPKIETIFKINNEDTFLSLNQSLELKVDVNNDPNPFVLWHTDNLNSCKIGQNYLYAIDYGVCNIKAIYTDIYGEEYSDSFKVIIGDGDSNIKLENVFFDKKEIAIRTGDEYKISLVYVPNNAFIDNKKYTINGNCSIINDTIKANSDGLCIINVLINNKFQDEMKIYSDYSIKSNEQAILPEKLEFLVDDIELKVGETLALKYNYSPTNVSSEYIKIKVDNDNVSYENGILKALKAGDSIITIESVNKLYDTVSVHIKENEVPVSNIEISGTNNKNGSIIMSKNEYKIITAKVLPENATNKVLKYESSNPSVATVDNNGKISAVSIGECKITVTSNNGISKTIDVKVERTNSYCDMSESINFSKYSLMTSVTTTEEFNRCRSASPNLVLKYNGSTHGQDSNITLRLGESFDIEVYLPTQCGGIALLTRNSADGQDNWRDFVEQDNLPFVDRCDTSTYKQITHYTWRITAKKQGSVTLSQTAQFGVKGANGGYSVIKSMIRLNVKIV